MLYKNKISIQTQRILTVLLVTTTEKCSIPYLATSAVILKGKSNRWGFHKAYQLWFITELWFTQIVLFEGLQGIWESSSCCCMEILEDAVESYCIFLTFDPYTVHK